MKRKSLAQRIAKSGKDKKLLAQRLTAGTTPAVDTKSHRRFGVVSVERRPIKKTLRTAPTSPLCVVKEAGVEQLLQHPTRRLREFFAGLSVAQRVAWIERLAEELRHLNRLEGDSVNLANDYGSGLTGGEAGVLAKQAGGKARLLRVIRDSQSEVEGVLEIALDVHDELKQQERARKAVGSDFRRMPGVPRTLDELEQWADHQFLTAERLRHAPDEDGGVSALGIMSPHLANRIEKNSNNALPPDSFTDSTTPLADRMVQAERERMGEIRKQREQGGSLPWFMRSRR